MKKIILALLALAGLVLPQAAQSAGTQNGQVTTVLIDSRQCVFFILAGVPVADPTVTSYPWFALPKSSPMFTEMYSLLLSYKMAQKIVSVQTDGTASCGHTTAAMISVP